MQLFNPSLRPKACIVQPTTPSVDLDEKKKTECTLCPITEFQDFLGNFNRLDIILVGKHIKQ